MSRDLKAISLVLCQRSEEVNPHSYLAILDWPLARRMIRDFGKNQEDFLIYPMRYSTELPVGLFTPKGDQRFADVIERCIRKNLMYGRSWTKEVESDMERSLIHPLSEGPRRISEYGII